VPLGRLEATVKAVTIPPETVVPVMVTFVTLSKVLPESPVTVTFCPVVKFTLESTI